jgi:hypothetical protein
MNALHSKYNVRYDSMRKDASKNASITQRAIEKMKMVIAKELMLFGGREEVH